MRHGTTRGRVWRYLAAMALVGSACAGGSDDGGAFGDFMGDDDTPSTSVPFETATTETTTSDGSDLEGARDSGVAPLNCGALLTTEDREFALDVWERDDGPLQTIGYSQGESCIESGRDDDTTYVKIEPGSAADFTAGARLLETSSVAVDQDGVLGDDLRWFAGEGEGSLAVMLATELGDLRVRLGLGRPELTDAERLEIALELSRRVLPRFPGVDAPEVPIELVELDEPVVDRRADSYVDHLLAREAAGEWSRGEGLVQLLSAVAGETSESATLGGAEITPTSGTPLLGLARDEIAAGPDGELAAELERLIDELTFHRDEFDGPAPIQTFRRAAPTDCPKWFGTDVCVRQLGSLDLDEQFGNGKYQVFGPQPAPPAEIAGWTESKIFRVLEAVEESAIVLEDLGTMPLIDVVITNHDHMMPAWSDGGADNCSISVTPAIQPYNNFQFKQWIAGEMAHCFNAATFSDQFTGGYEHNLWWSAGMSIFLSNVIYPNANLEWKHLPDSLAGHELSTSIFERGATNGMFFQHLEFKYGLDGIIDLVGQLPSSPTGQAAAARSWPDIHQTYHDYLHSLSDLGVPDGGTVQLAGTYDPQWTDFRVSEPAAIERPVDAFEVERIWMIVEAGSWACMDYDPTGGVLFSWREGNPKQAGVWQGTPPEQVKGMVVFAGSSIKDGEVLRITVERVVDDPDECDEESDESGVGPTGQSGDGAGGGGAGDAIDCPATCGPSEYYG